MVPGLTTLLVTLDPDVTTAAAVESALADLRPGAELKNGDERHVIDVRYDGEDLDEVARLTGLTPAEVVAAHTGTPWRVAFCGFAPGFSYLVGGDSAAAGAAARRVAGAGAGRCRGDRRRVLLDLPAALARRLAAARPHGRRPVGRGGRPAGGPAPRRGRGVPGRDRG